MEPNVNKEMDDGAQQRIDDEDYETCSLEVEKARKRRHIEYYANATIPITAHEKEEKMAITPPKEDDVKKVSSVNVETPLLSKQDTVEGDATSGPKEKQQITVVVNPYPCKSCKRSFKTETGLQHHNRDSHEEKPTTLANKIMKIVGSEHRNSDEDYETSSFEDVAPSESDDEEVAKKVKEERKRRHIKYFTNATIPITAHKKTDNMVITPQEDDMNKVSSVNVGTIPLSKEATDEADAIGLSKKNQITIGVLPYPCKFCKRSFRSEKGLHHHIRDNHVENPSKLANNTVTATSMKIVEPNENTKMDGGEHRSDDEDYETGGFKVEKARKRKHLEIYANATIPPITTQEKKEKIDDVKEVSSVNVETLPLSKQATVEADAISGLKEKQQITIVLKPYPCNSCKRSFKSEKGLEQHIKDNHKERNSVGIL